MNLIVKRSILWIGVLLLLLLLAGIVIVFQARTETPAVIEAALRSPQVAMLGSDLPPGFRDILLRVEDPQFYVHHGFDLTTPGAGKTTITQGLVKVFYFSDFTPGLINKIIQTLVARFAYDPIISKKDQLTLFINYAYMGTINGKEIIGLPAAAKFYYGKEIPTLTHNEYIALVGMLIAPNSLDPVRHPRENEQRLQRIKRLLSGAYTPKDNDDVYYDR